MESESALATPADIDFVYRARLTAFGGIFSALEDFPSSMVSYFFCGYGRSFLAAVLSDTNYLLHWAIRKERQAATIAEIKKAAKSAADFMRHSK